MSTERPRSLRATCAPGLTPWLAAEVEALGFELSGSDHTGVETSGTMVDAMRLLLNLRTAFHVLQRFADIYPRDADDLYEQASGLPWERVIPVDGYLSVVSVVQNDTIRNSMFPNVRLKDAIVDRLQRIHGRRPNSGPRGDRTVVHLFWKDRHGRLALDLAGRKLSDRGYRRIPAKAPLRESIAAAILSEVGWTGQKPLVIPMCGSGTIAIEAALIAAGRAPGLLRSNFGIQHLLTFNEEDWRMQRKLARRQGTNGPLPPIIASDIDPAAVEASRRNAVTAGVDHLIDFQVGDFAATPLPSDPGTIILHGEYGERLGTGTDLRATYARIGDWFKQSCVGWQGWVFTARELAGAIGLKASRRVPFDNAGTDCRLTGFDLYPGSKGSEEMSASEG